MRVIRLATVLLLLSVFWSGCAALSNESPATLRGRIELDVAPNPLVARRVSDDLYEFAFDIIMREAGGVDVRIEDFTVEGIAFRTLTVQTQTFPASYITDRGYPATIAPGRFLRFRFVKRWNIPSRLLLSGASVHVIARTVDANGRRDVTDVRIGVTVK